MSTQEKVRKKLLTIGSVGFKVRPKLIRHQGRWYPVDPEAWKLVQRLELKELREAKKKKSKKVL